MFTIDNVADFAGALKFAKKIVTEGNISDVLLEADQDGLQITVTNGLDQLQIQHDCFVQKKAVVVVDLLALERAVTQLKRVAPIVEVIPGEHQTEFCFGSQQIVCLPNKPMSDPFIVERVTPKNRMFIPERLLTDLQKLTAMTSNSRKRPIFTNLHFAKDYVVATDSWRLGMVPSENKNVAGSNVPNYIFSKYLKMSKKQHNSLIAEGFYYQIDSNWGYMYNERFHLRFPLGEGTYPNWRSVIPTELESYMEVSLENNTQLQKQLDVHRAWKRKSEAVLGIKHATFKSIIFYSTANDESTLETEIPAKIPSIMKGIPTKRYGINVSYVLDALAFLGDSVRFYFQGERVPQLIEDDHGRKVVIMPIVLD